MKRQHNTWNPGSRYERAISCRRLQVESLENRWLLVSDFGDAPVSYGTTLANNGARHDATGPTLGVTRDSESDATAPLDSTGDGADEDGVTFGTVQVGEVDASVTVNVQDGSAKLDAWIDFNNDGTFDGAGEQIATSAVVNTNDNTIMFDVPADAVSGEALYARFRLSSAGGLGPRGAADDGEVEDHTVTLNATDLGDLIEISNQTLANSAFSTSVSLGDVDGDGDLDAFLTNREVAHQVWANQGGDQGGTPGTFVDSGQVLMNSEISFSVDLGDVDRDGDLDAFVAIFDGDHQVWTNQGGAQGGILGMFVNSGQMLTNSFGSRSVSLGDLDGDGDLDAFVANRFGDHQVWANQGGAQHGTVGMFTNSMQSLTNMALSLSVSLGDVDGDGDLDAFVANNQGNNQGHQVWTNQGGAQSGTPGMFANSGQPLTNPANSFSVHLGDTDGDGDLDAFVANSNGAHQVWTNQGGAQSGTPGMFANSGQTLANSSDSRSVSLGDVDGDGDLDALVATSGGAHRVWANQGGAQSGTLGSFAGSGQPLTNSALSTSLSLGDVDGDGDLDVFVATYGSNHQVWTNSLKPDFGDAPDSYGTRLGSNGARHGVTGPTLGAKRDTESDAVSPLNGSGDGDDEDGVTINALRVGRTDASAVIDVRGAEGKLDAWMDFDGSGTWESAEKIFADADVAIGEHTLFFSVPAAASVGNSYARFRLSTDGSVDPMGFATDGEVEDYPVTIMKDIVVTLPTGTVNDIVVQQKGNDVEVIDQSGPTVLSRTPIETTYSLMIMGSATDVDKVLIDYQTGGFFALFGGIDVLGGSGAGDSLKVTGTGNTQVAYATTDSPDGATLITVSDTSGSDVIRYANEENLTFDNMLTFAANSTVDVGANSLTIGSATPVNLSNLTLINGGTLTADSIALGSGESIVGSGTIDARFAGEAGSLIQATGNLTIGETASSAGFSTRGDLDVGTNTVTLLDANQAGLGLLTTLGLGSVSGILDAANGLLVDFGNNVTGFGTINTPIDPLEPLINNGSILGNSPTEPITLLGHIKGVGTLDNVDVSNATLDLGFSPAAVNLGNVIYGANSLVNIELGGTTPGSGGYDQLNHSGSVSLDGTLQVQLVNNFAPSYGNVFDVVTWAGTQTGTFTGFPGILLNNNTVAVIPKYESQHLRLLTTGPGDANLDGRVSFADFLVLQNHFNQPGNFTKGDFNLDNNVSFADFLILQNAFNQVYFSDPLPAVAAADLDARDQALADFDSDKDRHDVAEPLNNQNGFLVRGAVEHRRMVLDVALRERRQRRQRFVPARILIDEDHAEEFARGVFGRREIDTKSPFYF